MATNFSIKINKNKSKLECPEIFCLYWLAIKLYLLDAKFYILS